MTPVSDSGGPSDSPGIDGFLDAIRISPSGSTEHSLTFDATTGRVPWAKAYGGDLLAQAVTAGQASVDETRVLHSMHSSFLRPAAVAEKLRYEVELTRDGRSYSTRQVRALQGGKVIYIATLSFQVQEEGIDYAPEMPAVEGPENIPSSQEYLRSESGDHGLRPPVAEYWSRGRAFDQRHVDGPLYLTTEHDTAGHQAVWVKAFATLPDSPGIHQAALAYVSDYTILEPSLRVMGTSWSDVGLTTASLDNSIWFHRPARADDWLLYVQEAESVQRGRGLNRGRFFDRAGHLVATVMQEGMLRTERGTS